MGAIEPAMHPGLRRADQTADQLEVAEPGGDAQVDRFTAQELGDFAVAPDQRRDQRGTSVATSKQIGARAGVQHHSRELAIIPVAGVVQLRPAVVVSPVGIRAPLQQQRDDRQIAGHPEQVVAVGPPLGDEVREPVQESDEALAIVLLNRSVGPHEGRRRFLAAAHRLDMATQRAPAGEPVAGGEVTSRLRGADAQHQSDSVGAALVVVHIGAKRLLELEALDVGLEPRPVGEPSSRASSNWTSASFTASPAARRSRTRSFTCLRSCSRSSEVVTWARPCRADWMLPSPHGRSLIRSCHRRRTEKISRVVVFGAPPIVS